MAFDRPARNRGRFDPSRPLEVVVGVRGLVKGELLSSGSRSRRAAWWRRGWVKYAENPKAKKRSAPVETKPAPIEAPPSPEPSAEQGGAEETNVEEPGDQSKEPEAVSAEEGEKGWWRVLFDDGTEKNLRRSAVEKLGLAEPVDG